MSALGVAIPMALLLGGAPFREEHPLSREARERIASGAPERALESYSRLEAETGPRPEIDLGRGTALLDLGRPGEADLAFARAREAPEPLGSRALLGLSDARAGKGDLEGAIAAAREALVRDPAFEDARRNLELLLGRRAGSRRPGTGEGRGDGGRDERDGTDAGERPSPEGPQPARAPGAPGEEEQARAHGSEREDPGAGSEEALSRREAERLLDALGARERNLPASAAKPHGARRPDAEKDW